MPLTIEQLESEALKLPASSRAELAEKLVGSLHGAEDANYRKEWADEARRRLEDVRNGRVETIPGEFFFNPESAGDSIIERLRQSTGDSKGVKINREELHRY